ncbi:MAG: NAD(P)H-dependent oxidoreductase subunit E [Phycisphaerales bacterium]|nr:NAD(P)H-dependent oxidoreductase subunit E [Phycisphaerales bacterium]
MAWITKNSGGAKIERRDEPYLTQAIKDTVTRTYLPRYETKMGALLPTLHLVQQAHNWLPHQALIEIAEFLGLKPADVIDTASFYEEYWLKPKGACLISVCRSIACEFCGSKAVTDACRRRLGIEPGETTDDGKFTLIELECLGSCGTAPAALFNHTLHENLTPEKVERLIEEAERSGSHGHH